MRILLDESLPKDLATLAIAVVVLLVHRTRIDAIAPLVPELLNLPNHLLPKVLRKIGV